MDKLLKLLSDNARLNDAQIAAMLGKSESEVATEIARLEKEGIICGYNAVINWDKADAKYVTALIELRVSPKKDRGFDDIAKTVVEFEEVESVYLVSGGFDLYVTVIGKTFQDIAMFVAKRLSPLDSVLSTATHFVMNKYKESGIFFSNVEEDERRNIF